MQAAACPLRYSGKGAVPGRLLVSGLLRLRVKTAGARAGRLQLKTNLRKGSTNMDAATVEMMAQEELIRSTLYFSLTM